MVLVKQLKEGDLLSPTNVELRHLETGNAGNNLALPDEKEENNSDSESAVWDDSADDDNNSEAGDDGGFCLGLRLYLLRRRLRELWLKLVRSLGICVPVMYLCLYLSYFSYAMYLRHDDSSISGLIVITVIIFLVLLVRGVSKYEPIAKVSELFLRHPKVANRLQKLVVFACVVVGCVTLITEVVLIRPKNLVSLTGIAGIYLVFFITSTHPHKVIWRPVISGLFLQYVFALAILRLPGVQAIFMWAGDVISLMVKFSKTGGQFLFGELANTGGFVLIVIPIITFMIAFLSVLEHLGVLHALLKIVGRFLAFCTGASPVETLNAAANIFMGPIDSIMVVRPYLKRVTSSELHCLMSNEMATLTGSVIGLYIMLGISADHLLTASVMSAPAALSVAKLAVPETRRRKAEKFKEVGAPEKRYRNVVDAASSGATGALTMAGAIIANVTIVISFIDMLNSFLGWLGGLVGIRDFTLQWICSYLFYPLALSLGVDVIDGYKVADLLGMKVLVNEIIAYTKLAKYRKNRLVFEDYLSHNFTEWSLDVVTSDVFLPGWNVTLKEGFLTMRSEAISTYALCGFANFLCVVVIMATYIVLVPHRKRTVYKYVLRAMLVGHCASFLTACVAGSFNVNFFCFRICKLRFSHFQKKIVSCVQLDKSK
ncbi:unnamed protein product [Lymnaea stagnalis]|uniref:Solute carrier family 28 member 3 n=1 Tax=Lymnaea stagnalis TaxID=6523 RepID=A0AAV2I9Q0_LYMST